MNDIKKGRIQISPAGLLPVARPALQFHHLLPVILIVIVILILHRSPPSSTTSQHVQPPTTTTTSALAPLSSYSTHIGRCHIQGKDWSEC
jgi:hypothetical protein